MPNTPETAEALPANTLRNAPPEDADITDPTPPHAEREDPERYRLLDDPRIERTDMCWIWHGARTAGGYGRYNEAYAHRLAYEQAVGPIPDGHEVMHLCDNPPCVNPDHLRAGTHAENMRDARDKGRLNTDHLWRRGDWEMCGKGLHPLSGENLYVDPKGVRECRACKKQRRKEWGERNGR